MHNGSVEDKRHKLKEWYAITRPIKEKLKELHADVVITCKEGEYDSKCGNKQCTKRP